MRALAVETRALLDRAELLVARCRCLPEDVFLVDPARGTILASRSRALPRGYGRISPPESSRRVALEIAADAPDATIEWQGRTVRLPLRLDEIRASEIVRAKVRAKGREPYVIERAPREDDGDGPLGRALEAHSWFLVLRRAPDRGARK